MSRDNLLRYQKVPESLKRNSTETCSFGASRRESHDSSKFYSRKLYSYYHPKSGGSKVIYRENAIALENLDRVFCKSSETMEELPDSSIHLVVTSPPYNVGKDYDKDLTLEEYQSLLVRVFKEMSRVLVHGGRACINVANLGRKPYIPVHSFIISAMTDLGFLMRGEIIWNKSASSGTSTAWGSWLSPSNPVLRDTHEYILVFSKGTFSRAANSRESTIKKDEFLTFTKSVREFPAESASRVGHPAPFPVELPYRCLQLYTFKGDVVLDPFCGAGSTCLAALENGRHFVGYDNNEKCADTAAKRIKDCAYPKRKKGR